MTTFSEVKKILDDVILKYVIQNNELPNLTGKHRSSSFGWATRAQLLGSEVVSRTGTSFMLIDPAHIGNGQGDQTNLVIALRTGVPGFPRMPLGGPFIDDDNLIKIIVDWIDNRCPE